MALNASSDAATSLAVAPTSNSASGYQITRPRWYNKAEVAIIVLLCQRLRMIDLKGVEHMLDAAPKFAKEDPRDVWQRALYLSKAAPGANFRTVIQRHPRTLLVPVHKMQHVLSLLSEAYPDANMARVVERIPSVLSRNTTRLEDNIAGLKKYAPEVNSAIFQAAPSMVYLPAHTVEEKVAALRACLPGIDLYNFLKGMPTALARSKQTVPRGMDQLRERFPSASNRELVRIVESAPSLVRMSGANGSLSIKVTKLQELFPSANVTKMVSRTPGIMYLDVDRTVRSKAMWIQQAVGLDQEGLDRLVEQGPWLLKAGWGPLARLEFAIEAGVATVDRPSTIFSLVRRSRLAFARAHHESYGSFLRKKLEEEAIELGGREGGGGGGEGGDLHHPLAWRAAAGNAVDGGRRVSRPVSPKKGSGPKAASATLGGKRTARLENAGATPGVVLESGDGKEEDQDALMERTALEVAGLEDALGRGRKSRLGGVKDRPPNPGQSPLARLQGSRHEGDALLDLGKEKIVAYDSPPQPQLGA
ncbi:expressed unknown protein [Ectocarpus siliculosus]|uniref:Uncharacterized protein n=1 Tax=Ectocarpus siliculosus TaxID=2880 RepID=D8LF09_ECTSI|nr:expressed unknown protein [Ectocarpus siliculosus]|eukprot:CBN79829.1 expressed unknown protein [Ectocarpus siliculosus]